jgi:7-cyano-7-deazaguanine reductase
MSTSPTTAIETFANPSPQGDYTIRMTMPEFTCLCPKTGQPDFATLKLEYVPDQLCIELKSLKLYIWSFRNRGCYHEAVTNEILHYLAGTVTPRYMRLTADFLVRGGIYTSVVAEHSASGWRPGAPVALP